MKTLKSRLTDLEKKVICLINQLKDKNIIQDAKQPEAKSSPVEPLVKPQMADELTKTKVQLYLAMNENIAKEAKELRGLMMIKLDGNDCEIKYKTDTGEPFLNIRNFTGYSLDNIKFELESVRKLKQWLNDIGI